jgi:propanol-preferring alcohol dehydrogenase
MLDLMSKHKIHVKTNTFYGIHSIPKLIEFAHSGKMAGKGVVIIDEELVAKEQEDING